MAVLISSMFFNKTMKNKIAFFLTLFLVWLTVIPLLFLLIVVDPQQIIQLYIDLGAELPSVSQLIIYYVTLGRVFFLGIITSLLMLVLHSRIQNIERLTISRLIVLIMWHVLLLPIYLAVLLPNFKVFEELG